MRPRYHHQHRQNTDLNNQCTVPWTGPGQNPAPQCCTSDLTLDEFKTLQAKMDASNPSADTAEGFLGGTANWRTDLYTPTALTWLPFQGEYRAQ